MHHRIQPFQRGAKWTDAATMATLNELVAAINRVGDITGDGTITVDRSVAGGHRIGLALSQVLPKIPKPLPIRWGKATAAWTTGNTVTIDPCDMDGNDLAGEPNVTAYVVSPTAGEPDASIEPEIAINDVLAYLPFHPADGTRYGVLLNPKLAADEAEILGPLANVAMVATVRYEITGNAAGVVVATGDWSRRSGLLFLHGLNAESPTAADQWPGLWTNASAYAVPFFVASQAPNTGQRTIVNWTGVLAADVLVYCDTATGGQIKMTVTNHAADCHVVVSALGFADRPAGTEITIP